MNLDTLYEENYNENDEEKEEELEGFVREDDDGMGAGDKDTDEEV